MDNSTRLPYPVAPAQGKYPAKAPPMAEDRSLPENPGGPASSSGCLGFFLSWISE